MGDSRAAPPALEVGERILAVGVDPAVQTEVRFDLVDAMIDAGRWDDATATSRACVANQTRLTSARRAIGDSEVALARNDRLAAMAFARGGVGRRASRRPVDLTCRALWLIGRVERGRDIERGIRGLRRSLRLRDLVMTWPSTAPARCSSSGLSRCSRGWPPASWRRLVRKR